MEDITFLIRGFDEADYHEFAYEIKDKMIYSGLVQIRPEKIPANSEYTLSMNRNIDGDWFMIDLPTEKKVRIQLHPNKLTSGRIDLYHKEPLEYSNINAPSGYFTTFVIGQNNSVLTSPNALSAGKYYFRITHRLDDILDVKVRKDAWQYPYDFTVTLLNSNIKELTNRANEKNIVIGEVYPNPFNSSFNVDIDNLSNEVILKVELTLSNSLNQTIMSKSESLNGNKNIITIPAFDLSSGVYYLTVKVKDELKTFRLIKI
jgi:hypothetical protein